MAELTDRICANLHPERAEDEDERLAFMLLHSVKGRFPGTGYSSIEDYLSEIQDIDAILGRLEARGLQDARYPPEDGAYRRTHTQLAMRRIKDEIKRVLSSGPLTLKFHRTFCRALHRNLVKGKERVRRPVNYFILNYDTLFEDALGLEGIVFEDGFVGGSVAWWALTSSGELRSCVERASLPEAMVWKLHGSVDWIRPNGYDYPLRVRENLLDNDDIVGSGEPVVIYPSSFKYRETQRDPFSQMLIRFRKCLAESDNHVLMTIGYAFNDEHINHEIGNELRRNQSTLNLVAFVGEEDLPEELQSWVHDPVLGLKIRVFGRCGAWLHGRRIGESGESSDWYKFEILAERLGDM